MTAILLERESKQAYWSRRVAVFAVQVAVISLILHRLDFLGPRVATNLLGVSADRLLGTYTQSNQVFDATVCFSDIPFFTKRAEGLAPEDVATIINAHDYQITELVLRDGGIPVK